MRSHYLGFIVLSTFCLLANAGFVHVDFSRNGDVAVDIDTKQQHPSTPSKLGKFGKPVYPPKQKAHVLEDNQVDLGYEIHAGFPSESGKFLAFKNIPYAEPPLGELRWFPPIYPENVREGVNEGLISHICPQTQVGWVPKAIEFLGDFQKFPLPPKWREPITPENYGKMPEQDERVNEDCLTLDVMVPETVWNERNRAKAAVVVWIYGGGFVYGWKDQYGSPEGLFDAADRNKEGNIIYVAMNYRLGAFGWLGGPRFQDDGGIANIGLYDQKFALSWVQEHIHAFGVTVMGQSAGASSIMHHITASGGERDRPEFEGAILQSPGFFPQPNSTKDDATYTRFLNLTGAADLEALKKLGTEILMEANANMTFESMYGYFNFGPTVDGLYVPDLPGKLLKDGRFHKHFPMMLGYTSFDGLLFTPPWIRSSQSLLDHVRELFPGVPNTVLAEIKDKYPISSPIAQSALVEVSDFLDDIAIQCNCYYLTQASTEPLVFKYSFNALPAVHGYDVGYTYYPSPPPIEPVNATLAKFFQDSIVNFAQYFDPNPEDSMFWEMYESSTRRIMNLGKPGQSIPDYSYEPGDDLQDGKKCDYWQTAPYYSPTALKDAKLVKQGDSYKDL